MTTHQHGQDSYTDTECPCGSMAGKPVLQDIDWILTSAVTVSKLRAGYYVVQQTADNGFQCTITFGAGDRMLFNGQDIETEEHMAYVGMLDQVDQAGGTLFFPPEPAW